LPARPVDHPAPCRGMPGPNLGARARALPDTRALLYATVGLRRLLHSADATFAVWEPVDF